MNECEGKSFDWWVAECRRRGRELENMHLEMASLKARVEELKGQKETSRQSVVHYEEAWRKEEKRAEGAEKECQEQARINGMGAQRELKLITERDALKLRAERLEGALKTAGKFLGIFIQGGEWEHEDPECPCDDTCECENALEMNSIFKEIKALSQEAEGLKK